MIVAPLNQKSRAGKTTLARRVAGAWGRFAQQVTPVDDDPQRSILDWCEYRAREGLSRLFGIAGLRSSALLSDFQCGRIVTGVLHEPLVREFPDARGDRP